MRKVNTDHPHTPRETRGAVYSGGAHLLVRQIISILLKFIGLLVITRVLGPENYGTYVSAMAVYAYLTLLGVSGIGVYLVRATLVSDAIYGTAYTLQSVLAFVLSVGILFTATLFEDWSHVPGVAVILSILALAFPFHLLSIPAQARLERALDFRSVARVDIIAQISFYIFAIPLIVLGGYNSLGLAIGWLVQQIINFLLSHLFARRWPIYKFNLKTAREIFLFSGTYSVATMVWNARVLANPMIVGPLLGPAAVGLVGMTIGLCDMLTVLKTIAWRLSTAAFSRIQNDLARMRDVMVEGMELQMLLLGAILLSFSWFGNIVVPTIFGARWLPLMEVYPFVALAYFTHATFNMQSSALVVLRKNIEVVFYNIFHIVFFLASAYSLVPRFGVVGYGWAELVALPGASFYLYLRTNHAVGRADYSRAGLWWVGVAIGLFWRSIGVWGVMAPFVALLTPHSIRRIISLYNKFKATRAVSLPELERTHFLFLRTDDPKTDFRMALARELQSLGHDVTYVYLRRRFIVIDPSNISSSKSISFWSFLIFGLRNMAWRRGLVVFNSSNLAFPGLSLFLRVFFGGFWCFDLHDDLVYGAKGFQKIRKNMALWLLTRTSNITICASPLLGEIVPRALHLGNASSLQRVEHNEFTNERVLILASIDERFDFDFVRDVACCASTLVFIVRGRFSGDEALLRERASAMVAAAPNVRFEGPYVNSDLHALLASFDVALAPYVTNTRATRYIDPLRFYHCSRAGLELITTDIPGAASLGGLLHVVDSANDAARILKDLGLGLIPRRNRFENDLVPSWRDRANQLLRLLATHRNAPVSEVNG